MKTELLRLSHNGDGSHMCIFVYLFSAVASWLFNNHGATQCMKTSL